MAYAAATASKDSAYSDGKVISFKMDAVKIYKGSLVGMDASAGYATSAIPQASRPFLGVAEETVDNSGGSAGDKSIRVRTEGVFEFNLAGSCDQTYVGKEVYWDSGSSGSSLIVVLSDPGVGPKVGRVVEFISATRCRVRITGYALVQDNQAS